MKSFNREEQELINSAFTIARDAHRDQKDKAGAPYIYHPARVSHSRWCVGIEEVVVALLHDVIEDTCTTSEHLIRYGIPEHIVSIVECLTRRPNESYADFIERCCTNPIAARVKLADLEDNLDVTRFKEINENDLFRLNRYLRARERIMKYLFGH